MDRLIYTALTGMRARLAAQAVTANNLANAQVTGFRREISSLASRYLAGPEGATRVQAADAEASSNMEPGRIDTTGQPLDVAIDGPGWIAVQTVDGNEAYTRRGDLRVAPTGVLETGDGHPVIGTNGVITMPAGEPSIAPGGAVSVRLAGAAAPVLIDHIRLVNPAPRDLHKDAAGLFRSASTPDPDPEVRLQTGALEAANVDTARVLAELVEQSRGFDVSTKLLGATREIDEAGARLMRLDN
jgi:flagellar basal-body rod protein FlgF